MQLSTVKDYLDITWQDEATDSKVTKILARAESVIAKYLGGEVDFTDETTEEAQLLLDCCRYIWNHAFEDFENNFGRQIYALRMERSVNAVEDTGV